MEEGKISKRLFASNCEIILEKISSKIDAWLFKNLSKSVIRCNTLVPYYENEYPT